MRYATPAALRMALEVRLRDAARLTKDVDLGLRAAVNAADELYDRMIEALSTDPDTDGFIITATRPQRLREDGGGHVTWRLKTVASLAGRPFGAVQLDVSPRSHELIETDRVRLPNSLAFAGLPDR